jgi:hypothetical protein
MRCSDLFLEEISSPCNTYLDGIFMASKGVLNQEVIEESYVIPKTKNKKIFA